MNSYRTVEEARTAAANHPKSKDLRGIIEIVPGIAGVEKYVVANCLADTLRSVLVTAENYMIHDILHMS